MYVKLSTGHWFVDLTHTCRGTTYYEKTMAIISRLGHTPRCKDYLDTCIHESIHASRPDLSESEVYKLANDITAVLWKLNYRKSSRRAYGRRPGYRRSRKP